MYCESSIQEQTPYLLDDVDPKDEADSWLVNPPFESRESSRSTSDMDTGGLKHILNIHIE